MENIKRLNGVVIPLSYLRTKNSLGIGNIGDLKQFIGGEGGLPPSKIFPLPGVKGGEVTFNVIQLLPINDTGESNLWPYSAISSFAINPVYLDINNLFSKYEKNISKKSIAKHKKMLEIAKEQENLSIINYPEVRKNILNLAENIFDEVADAILPEIEKFSKQYKWVNEYVEFLELEAQRQKGKKVECRAPAGKTVDQGVKSIKKNSFYVFLQMELLNQLKEVKKFANENGIYLKGDIPILTSSNSADVWAYPDYFLLDYGAGAPPDMFTLGGQEWGNPPLNVENPKAVEYFIERFKYAENYMDMVRIDHVLGLFRLMIWQKNKGNILTQGFFYPQSIDARSVNVTISDAELKTLGLTDLERFTKLEGIITDIDQLGDLAHRCVEIGLAQYVFGESRIKWIGEEKFSGGLRGLAPLEETISSHGLLRRRGNPCGCPNKNASPPADDIGVKGDGVDKKTQWHKGTEAQSRENENLFYNQNHNLFYNEDYVLKLLRENNFTEEDAHKIVSARRKLYNMLGNYLNNDKEFFLTYYWQETWQYNNLSEEIKHKLVEFVAEKRQEQYVFWEQFGRNFLQLIKQKTKLILCAEDLGMVDDYIRPVLKELAIPGIDVIRWSASFKKADQREMAVLTTSTHDTESFLAWWQDENTTVETKKRFLTEFFQNKEEEVSSLSSVELTKKIIEDMFNSNEIKSKLVIIPYWELANLYFNEPDIRINIPGISNHENWLQRQKNI